MSVMDQMVVHNPYFLFGEELDPGMVPEAFVVMPRRDLVHRFSDIAAIDDEDFGADFLPETEIQAPADEDEHPTLPGGEAVPEWLDNDFDDNFDEDFEAEQEDEYGLAEIENGGVEPLPDEDDGDTEIDEEFDDE